MNLPVSANLVNHKTSAEPLFSSVALPSLLGSERRLYPRATRVSSAFFFAAAARKQWATEAECIKSRGWCQGEFSLIGTFFLKTCSSLAGLENYPDKTTLSGLQNQLPARLDLEIGIHQLLPVELDPPLLDQAPGFAVRCHRAT